MIGNLSKISFSIKHIYETKNFCKIEDELIIQKNDDLKWQIEIPKINLKAEIAEGTTKEIMDYFVGHFEETPKNFGNVCLAAHNRGYRVNYFENLKQLEIGDEINYEYKGQFLKYEVIKNIIIDETDWSNLEATKENKITLITCVEDMPQFRRCVVAKERKELYD